MLSPQKNYIGPWERVRRNLIDDIEHITAAINLRWASTFGASNLLSVLGGGTGKASLTAHAVVVGQGIDPVTTVGPAAAGTVLHGGGAGDPGFSAVVESDITLSDNTTNDVTSTKHGFAPKMPNDATRYLDGTGAYSQPPSSGIPIVGGLSPSTLGQRVTWLQKGDAVNNSAMIAVGMAAATITGGSGVFDNAGFWAKATSTAGNAARFSAAGAFTRFNLLPKLVVRLRTNSAITSTRILVGLNESFAGVDTDTPSLTTQRGIYVRYSTAAGDGGWVVQTVDGSGRTVSATILAIAASTVYAITITTISTSSINVDINGTTVNVTANIISGVNLGYEALVRDLAAATQSLELESVYLSSL